jgi:hypothetical protein
MQAPSSPFLEPFTWVAQVTCKDEHYNTDLRMLYNTDLRMLSICVIPPTITYAIYARGQKVAQKYCRLSWKTAYALYRQSCSQHAVSTFRFLLRREESWMRVVVTLKLRRKAFSRPTFSLTRVLNVSQ